MNINYHSQGKIAYHYYRCATQYRLSSGSFCQVIGGRSIDKAVSRAFLEAVSPASLKIHLKAIEEINERKDRLLEQLKLQLERAQYEADRVFRQFDAIEPENRLVARPLAGGF